jgi:hypothetical protein
MPPANARFGSKTVLTPLKWDVCITPESRHSVCDVIVCYGRAKLTDKHLASKIHCVDDGIIGWLERREQRMREIILFINSERTNFLSPFTFLNPV